MDKILALKAVADETRMGILTLLLARNYCVRALARKLGLSQATISQHLKVLREAGLLDGQKRGYYMHYAVRRDRLRALGGEIAALADIAHQACTPEEGGCRPSEGAGCRAKGGCDALTREMCHGAGGHRGEGGGEGCHGAGGHHGEGGGGCHGHGHGHRP